MQYNTDEAEERMTLSTCCKQRDIDTGSLRSSSLATAGYLTCARVKACLVILSVLIGTKYVVKTLSESS